MATGYHMGPHAGYGGHHPGMTLFQRIQALYALLAVTEKLFRTKPVQNFSKLTTNAAGARFSTWEKQGIFERIVAAINRGIAFTDPKIRAGVLKMLTDIATGKFSPQVVITLVTIACINIVRTKNFGSVASKVVFRLANEILDLVQNVGRHGGKGIYFIINKLYHLIEYMTVHYGKHIVNTILYYLVGYGKISKNHGTTTSVKTVIANLNKAEKKVISPIQAKVNRASPQQNLKGASAEELELVLKIQKYKETYEKTINKLVSEIPKNLNNSDKVKKSIKIQRQIEKLKDMYDEKIKLLQTQLERIRQFRKKTPIPSPPTKIQVNTLNKLVNKIVNIKKSNKSASPNVKSMSTQTTPPVPTPVKKTARISAHKEAGLVRRSLKKKGVHWASDVI